MGFFDSLFKKNQVSYWEPKKINNEREILTYDYAIKLIKSKNKAESIKGRDIMIKLAEDPATKDKRVFIWMAKECESEKSFSLAAQWYERAYHAGAYEVKRDFERCNNPYHINEWFDIHGERYCGTIQIKYENELKEKQRMDYDDAIKKLNNNPSQDEAMRCFHTIRLIASAYRCAVPEAQIWMGNYCETVEQNLEKATRWFKKASNNGSADGARCYADMLMSGRGVKKNVEEAIKYYKLAADSGHAEAQFVMGQHYQLNGEPHLASKYFHMSMNGGYTPAKEKIAQLESGYVENKTSEYERILLSKFTEIILNNNYDSDGLVEYFADIYQPDDFCKQAYDFCNRHYGKSDTNKIIFEYCMTAFYGCICSVALWNDNTDVYSNTDSVWGALYKQINVEFTDSNAERLLGTKQGEDKAEKIFNIIREFINIANPILKMSDLDEKVCLFTMSLSYKLGMLVAKNELDISNFNFEREFLARNNSNNYDEDVCCKENKGDYNTDEELKKPNDFYTECVEVFHNIAMSLSIAKRGLIFIPELMKIGENTILMYLKDPFFQTECNGNPYQYYYLIMSLSIETGMCFAARWHNDFDSLNKYVEEIIENGPADDANVLMNKYLSKEVIGEQGNELFNKIYDKWVELHEPYWDLKDPRAYTFKALVAAYQLGVSMILEIFGY